MSAPVHRAWKLLASLPSAEGAPWRTADSWSSSSDHAARAREALESPAQSYPAGTCLRVVSPSGKAGRVHVVGADGRARPLALPSDAGVYFGDEARDAFCADPVAWWRESADGRGLFRVAGEAAVRSGQDSPLHRAVVRAVCRCARDAMLVWEGHYPDDARPRTAIETTERWCDGAATRDEVDAARAAAELAEATAVLAWRVGWAREARAAERAVAWKAAAELAVAAAALAEAEALVEVVQPLASAFSRGADHARKRIALPEVLIALAGGSR